MRPRRMIRLPGFYAAVEDGTIIGTYALLRNDLNSRQDLWPWFACLWVNGGNRGKGAGARLLEHGLNEAAEKGYDALYLATDLENYYEKYGWKHTKSAYGINDTNLKVYEKKTAG